MAIGKAREFTPSVGGFKKFIGAAEVKILAINPTKEERNKLLGIDNEKEPVYLGETERAGKKIPYVNITFYVQPCVNMENVPISTLSFFISREGRINRDNTKYQVIDKYGYSGWATKEQITNKEQLLSSAGKPLMITNEYRAAYNGEIQLIEFIKNWVDIAPLFNFNQETREWFIPEEANKSEYECSLDMDKLFRANFSELKDVLKAVSHHLVKVAYGVRTVEDKEYQYVHNAKTASARARNYDTITKDIIETKERGGMSNITIDTKPFREYVVVATDFDQPTSNIDPFDSSSSQPTSPSAPTGSDDLPF